MAERQWRVANRLNAFLLGLFIGSLVCGFVAFNGAKRIHHLNNVVASMAEQLGNCEPRKEKSK